MTFPLATTPDARPSTAHRSRGGRRFRLAWRRWSDLVLVVVYASLLPPCTVASTSAPKLGPPHATVTPAQAAAWILDGDEHNGWFGDVVAGVGDVNRDGFAEVLVATLGHRPGGIERNVTVALYAGSRSGLATNAL